MGYREDMERCRSYIDEHLYDDIASKELSNMFGYSFFHFCHVFKSVNGMAVCAYIREQRLRQSALRLKHGQSVTEAAFDCGFDTASGFTKAFRRRYGVSPSEYKKGNMKGGRPKMKFEIKKIPAYRAIGCTFKPEEEINVRENGAYWHKTDFSAVSKKDYAALCIPNNGEIGIWTHPNEKTGELCYFFGPTVGEDASVPDGFEELRVPEAEYAVFTVERASDTQALAENIRAAWRYIFNDWFDNSGYAFDHGKMDFEYYLGEDSFICVPVIKK